MYCVLLSYFWAMRSKASKAHLSVVKPKTKNRNATSSSSLVSDIRSELNRTKEGFFKSHQPHPTFSLSSIEDKLN